MAKLRIVRRGTDCTDADTCAVFALPETPDGRVLAVAKPVTDPAEIAQLPVGPGEIAVWFPADLLPEVTRGEA
jgi:hypothetical protein